MYDFSQDIDRDLADIEFLAGKMQQQANMRALVRGMQERARHGEWIGGRPRLGYRLVATGKLKNKRPMYDLEIDPDEAALVRELFTNFEQFGGNGTALKLNREGKLKPVRYSQKMVADGITHRPWDGQAIRAIIRNPLYAGWLTWGTGKTVKSQFMQGVKLSRHFRPDLQIIDQATFDRCQALLKERSRHHVRDDQEPYAFTCLLRCSLCGGHMVGNTREQILPNGMVKSRTYVCFNRRQETDVCPHGKSMAESTAATGLIPFTATLLQGMIHKIQGTLQTNASEKNTGKVSARMEAELRASLAECETQENRLALAVAQSLIQPEQIRTVSQELTEKKARITDELNHLLRRAASEQEFQIALSKLEGDLEEALLRILKENPLALNRLLRFIFQKGSIELKAEGSPRWGRTSEVVGYKLTPEFESLCQ